MIRRLWARVMCRLFGHRPVRLVDYGDARVRVGEGCARRGCGTGAIRTYAAVGPRPRVRARMERL